MDELIKAGYKGDSIVLVAVMDDLSEIPKGELVADLSWTDKVIRTFKQNSSIHLYWKLVCDKLNAGGWTKKKYYEVKEVDIEWTPESVGENIWRDIQDAMYQHRKTSNLETKQVDRVYANMSKHLAATLGIDQSFPNRFND